MNLLCPCAHALTCEDWESITIETGEPSGCKDNYPGITSHPGEMLIGSYGSLMKVK